QGAISPASAWPALILGRVPVAQSTHSEWSPSGSPPDLTARARPADSPQSNLGRASPLEGLPPAVFGCTPVLVDERDRQEVVSLDLADTKASSAPSLTRSLAFDKIAGIHLLANRCGGPPCVRSSGADPPSSRWPIALSYLMSIRRCHWSTLTRPTSTLPP